MWSHDISRRDFIASTAVAAAASAVAWPAAAASKRDFKIIAFTKPFRQLNAEKTADLVADVGWDGVELPVRAKDGQITPDRVDDELPKFVRALRQKDKEVSIVTTDITEANGLAEKVLRAVAGQGVKRYRLGFFRYANDKAIPAQLAEIGARLRDLAALNKELGLQAGFQNHSGNGYVGAPIWDVWTMIHELDPKQIGYCFDIGHATLEAGESWPVNFRLAQPWLTAVFVKDFFWKKTEKGWKPSWCALGEGMISPTFFKMLRASSYDGPICQHHEYDLENDEVGHYKRDLATLKSWLAAASR